MEFTPIEAGEPIGVVALSGPVDSRRLERGLDRLRRNGRDIVLAPNLAHRSDYLAGSDDVRLAGLEAVLAEGVRCVIAARGGYGVSRIADRLDLTALAARGVCFVGFSDLTALITPLAGLGAAQVHGPMAACGLEREENLCRLEAVLAGRVRELFHFRSSSVVRPGRVRGVAMGGNLTMLTHLIGSPDEPDLTGSILFVEEVNEAPYRLDRMLTHLRRSGRLRGVKALMCGTLHRCGPLRDRSRIWPRLLREAVGPDTVVVTGLAFGHGARNLAFPIGVEVEVDTARGVVSWV